ncbi:MAG: signal peptidase II [Gammaproteobacteria bacterium]
MPLAIYHLGPLMKPAVMMALVAGLILIPLLDQALKLLALHRLPRGSVPLGLLGSLQVAQTQIWLARAAGPNLAVIWTAWSLAACALAIATALVPACAWFAGMLLGGSLSHALETSLRGCICDYVCLRFWPAFNLADVAITVGTLGVAGNLFMVITKTMT